MFLSTKELAQKWEVDPSLVLRLAREGRIEGAQHFGRAWLFPVNAKKPIDARTEAGKAAKEITFRLPLFLSDEDDFVPPLSDEEQQLRQAQIAAYACRFEDAAKLINPLSERAENRYVRIAALQLRCILCLRECDTEGFSRYLRDFNLALSGDFAYKTEMLLFRYRLDILFGHYKFFLESFRIDPAQAYHPSAHYEMLSLSIEATQGTDVNSLIAIRYDAYELICVMMEQLGHFIEAQSLHFSLLDRYYTQGDTQLALHHLRRGLAIAQERELLLPAAINLYYYPDFADEVLSSYPDDFAEKLRALAADLHDQFVRFMFKRDHSSYLGLLSDYDFALITYAMQKLSNKKAAQKLGVSEKTVATRYSEVYRKLGVSGKRELIELIQRTHIQGQFDD